MIEAVKARVRTHVYAIGGINASNAGEVMRGADRGRDTILGAPDPGIAARELAEIVVTITLEVRLFTQQSMWTANNIRYHRLRAQLNGDED